MTDTPANREMEELNQAVQTLDYEMGNIEHFIDLIIKKSEAGSTISFHAIALKSSFEKAKASLFTLAERKPHATEVIARRVQEGNL